MVERLGGHCPPPSSYLKQVGTELSFPQNIGEEERESRARESSRVGRYWTHPTLDSSNNCKEAIRRLVSTIFLDNESFIDTAYGIMLTFSNCPRRINWCLTRHRQLIGYCIYEALQRQQTPRSASEIAALCEVSEHSLLKMESKSDESSVYVPAREFASTFCSVYALPYDIELMVRQYVHQIEWAFPTTKHDLLAATSLCYIVKQVRRACGDTTLYPNIKMGLSVAGVDTSTADCVKVYDNLFRAKVRKVTLPVKYYQTTDGVCYDSYELVFKKEPKRK